MGTIRNWILKVGTVPARPDYQLWHISEWRVIMQDDYQPSSQVCDFNGIKFSDGAERALECNGCVCAAGRWICTSHICTEGYRDIEGRAGQDDQDDGDSPEDD